MLILNSIDDLNSVYQELTEIPHLLDRDDTFWIGAHLVKEDQTHLIQDNRTEFVWKWANGLPVHFPNSKVPEAKDDSKGCIRITLANGRNNDQFPGNERVRIDRTRCASLENFICSVEPMFGAELERFNNQSTYPLEQMIRQPRDFYTDCDQNQLNNIDTSNIDGKFFQFGGAFNGRKTCYYLR